MDNADDNYHQLSNLTKHSVKYKLFLDFDEFYFHKRVMYKTIATI